MTYFFFFNDTATTEIYTLSLHDALPIFFLLLIALRGLLVIFICALRALRFFVFGFAAVIILPFLLGGFPRGLRGVAVGLFAAQLFLLAAQTLLFVAESLDFVTQFCVGFFFHGRWPRTKEMFQANARRELLLFSLGAGKIQSARTENRRWPDSADRRHRNTARPEDPRHSES